MAGVRAAYDRAVGLVDPAMAALTTVAGGERSGCLVGFHTQCSIDPPLHAVGVSHANHTCGVVGGAERVALHLLDAADAELARLFGTATGDELDKFERCSWRPDAYGVPVLDVAGSWVTGTIVERLVTGDHTCLVVAPYAAGGPGGNRALRLSEVRGLRPGHSA